MEAILTSPILILDRFLRAADGQVHDLVTGRPVWVRRMWESPGARRGWRLACADVVCAVRDPAWITLVDHGCEGPHGWVEVYDLPSRPVRWRGGESLGREGRDRDCRNQDCRDRSALWTAAISRAAGVAEGRGLSLSSRYRRFLVDRDGTPALLPAPGTAVVQRNPHHVVSQRDAVEAAHTHARPFDSALTVTRPPRRDLDLGPRTSRNQAGSSEPRAASGRQRGHSFGDVYDIAHHLLIDVLETADPPCARVVTLTAATSAGADTWIERAARYARARGFVPVSSRWFRTHAHSGGPASDLWRVLRHRHVLVLHDVRHVRPDLRARIEASVVRRLAELQADAGAHTVLVRVIAPGRRRRRELGRAASGLPMTPSPNNTDGVSTRVVRKRSPAGERVPDRTQGLYHREINRHPGFGASVISAAGDSPSWGEDTGASVWSEFYHPDVRGTFPGSALNASEDQAEFPPSSDQVSLVRESMTVCQESREWPSLMVPLRDGSAVDLVVRRAAELGRRGRHADACRLLRRSIGDARRRGLTGASAMLSLVLGRLWHVRGQIGEAERALVAAREQFSDVGSTRGVVATVLHLGWLLLEADRLDECGHVLQAAREAADQSGDMLSAWAAMLGQANRAFWQGHPDEAATILSEVDDLHERHTAAPAVAEVPGVDSWTSNLTGVWGLGIAARPDVLELVIRLRVGLAGGRTTSTRFAARRVDARLDEPLTAFDRITACEADMLEFAATGAWASLDQTLASGLAHARAARAPLLALSLQLTHAECRSRKTGGPPSAVSDLRRWGRAAIPGLLRRRLDALVDPGLPSRVTPTGSTSPAEFAWVSIVALLQAIHGAGDERSGLDRACELCRQRLSASAVTVFGRSLWASAPILCANSGGRSCDSVLAHRAMDAELTIGPGVGPDPLIKVVPVTFAGAIVGAVAARWSVDCEPDVAAAGYLEALASACGPSVRALVEASATVPQGNGPTAAILGSSLAMAELRTLVMRAAATPFPVLIQGESGTGKELTARAIHLGSSRSARRFCAVNCAALADDLIEAELFGHARGAFTGAATDRAGLFEEADGGTLFLDEISELSARGQAKLLRAIQEGEVRRLGENVPRKVDVRIVAATNSSLSTECGLGRFRPDLFYRLDVIRIVVAPLRDRPEDMAILIARFWIDASRQAGSRALLAPEAVTALSRHDWPGNVRQLQNTLAALAVRTPRVGRIGGRDVAAVLSGCATTAAALPATLDAARRGFEVEFISAAIARAGGHRTRAAADLGVTRQGLAKLIRRLGVPAGDPSTAAEGAG